MRCRCTHSILFNGKGSVYCLSPDELAALVRPQVAPLLGGLNLTSTG